MNSTVTQSIAFLNEMMESIPKSVDKEFSSEVKKTFTVKKNLLHMGVSSISE